MLVPYADTSTTSRVPIVNNLLILANIVVYVLINFRPDAVEVILAHACHPDSPTATSIFTSLFLHAGFFHLAGNMLFLHIFGDNVEDTMGHLGYLLFYLGAGGIAAFFHIATATLPAVGASGAISGVMGAYVILFPKATIRFIWLFIPFFKRFELWAWVAIGMWFALQLADHAAGTESGVAYAAHIGGFIVGALPVALYRLAGGAKVKSERPPQLATGKAINLDEKFRQEKQAGLPCPACVKAMKSTQIEGMSLELCYECGGLWMDRGETERLLQREQLPYSLENPPARDPKSVVVPHGQRRCPKCESPLVLADIEGVDAEGCRGCGGLWLEKGELGELRARLGPS